MFTLQELSEILQVPFRGNGDYVINKFSSLNKAKFGDISFFLTKNSVHEKFLMHTLDAVVILSKENSDKYDFLKNVLIVDDPYVTYAKVSKLFVNERSKLDVLDSDSCEIHSVAVVSKNCQINKKANIEAGVFVGANTIIGENVHIKSNCVIGDDVVIGANTIIYPNVTLYNGVKIDENCIIHSGAVLGSDGFGFANDRGIWVKIYQLGGLRIGKNVEIGANTTIDRGAIDDTIIEDGVKLDNQIQIGHNVIIGANTIISGCVGVAGSTKIGKNCMIGGGARINGHIEIADRTIVTACACVYKSITESGQIYSSGIPAILHSSWWRVLANLLKLDEIIKKIKKLEKKFDNEE